MYTEESLLALLQQDVEAGMEQIVEQFTGLVWSVAFRHLTNPEDIKECVNDTFVSFYLGLEHFDPAKGSLKTYLATIAQRRAVERWRENTRQPAGEAMPDVACADPILQAEDKLLLEDALAQLSDQDAAIIRMKYYNGMSAREIAQALNLPYETVKKRHQRSLSKLRKLLTIGLVLLLMAILAACSYVALRYLGVVPGYGVRTDEESSIYILEETAFAENEQISVELTKAILEDDTLCVVMRLQKMEGWTDDPEADASGQAWYSCMNAADALKSGEEVLERRFTDFSGTQGDLLYEELDTVWVELGYTAPEDPTRELTLTLSGLELSFRLTAVLEEDLEEYSFELTDLGGILADAWIEDGHLMASLYAVNSGEFEFNITSPGAVKALAPDGAVLEGELCVDGLFAGSGITTWDFGPAEPGAYTIQVSEVYLVAELPDTVSIPLREEWDDESWPVPGGTLTVVGWADHAPNPRIPEASDDGVTVTRFLELSVQPLYEGLTLENLMLYCTPLDGGNLPGSGSSTLTDDSSGDYWGIMLLWPSAYGLDELCLSGGGVTYKLEYAFSLPVTVS